MNYVMSFIRSIFFITIFSILQHGDVYIHPSTTRAVAWTAFMFFDLFAQLVIDIASGYLKLRASEKNADFRLAKLGGAK